GMIAVHGVGTSQGGDARLERQRQELFRRPFPEAGISGRLDPATVRMIDREAYPTSQKIGDYRYFLEPFWVAVDKWSMSVMGRSRTYTFADLLGGVEQDVLRLALEESLTGSGYRTDFSCGDLVALSNRQLTSLPGVDDPPSAAEVHRVFAKNCLGCHGLFAES